MLIHSGTVLSSCVMVNASSNALHIFFGAQTTKENSPDLVIPIKGKSTIDLFCPSVEGTVIWCKLKSGENRFYDIRTGERLTTQKLKTRSKVEKISFYE